MGLEILFSDMEDDSQLYPSSSSTSVSSSSSSSSSTYTQQRAKFKPGDIIMPIGRQPEFDGMQKYIGAVDVIKEVQIYDSYSHWYYLEGNCYIWAERWLKLYEVIDEFDNEDFLI